VFDFAEFIDVAQKIREAVRPLLGQRAARQVAGVAESGDTTFHLDEVAEQTLREALLDGKTRVAYYSEDRGVVELHENPEFFLLVDPIDGTRAFLKGKPHWVVSVALVVEGEVVMGCLYNPVENEFLTR
jgi:myo-inositol-1(or 4)-monophosphatase